MKYRLSKTKLQLTVETQDSSFPTDTI